MTDRGGVLVYENSDGTVGVRNQVVVLGLASFCVTAVEAIATAVAPVVKVTHPHGRNEIGVERERFLRSTVGTVCNGNVAGTVVVGYEPETTEAFVDAVRQHTDRPVRSVCVLDHGTTAAVDRGTRAAAELVVAASERRRAPRPVSELTVGVKCGGSDASSGIASNPAVGAAADWLVEQGARVVFSETTEIIGAEHILARRAATPEVGERIVEAARANEAQAAAAGIDLVGVNPVPDNIRGGLTTIEEKSLGAIAKTGTSPIVAVLGYGEPPALAGLSFMDSPSAASEVMTGLSAAGCHLILFTTGNGNPVGNAVTPVVKVTGNPRTMERVPEHVDVDVSAIFSGMPVPEAGRLLVDAAIATVEGRLTMAEVLGHREFAPIPVGL